MIKHGMIGPFWFGIVYGSAHHFAVGMSVWPLTWQLCFMLRGYLPLLLLNHIPEKGEKR